MSGHCDATTAAATPSLDQGFGYDELGRLTGITTATASWSLGNDANGNRTSVTQNASTSVYTTATTSNRLNSLSNPARSLGYDSAGNTTSDSAGYTSTYNLAGRMATLAKAGTTTTYSVDGMNRRVRKFSSTGASSTVLFVYDQGGQLLGEYSNTGAALREYVWLGSTPIAMFTPDALAANPPLVYYFHTDHLDTPRAVVDKSNGLRWRWLAEPFGTTAPENNPQGLGVFAQNLRFPGQYADAESGLNYNVNRDFDATLGRYVQSDPIGLAGGINTYAYVENQPTMLTDPLGLDPWWREPQPFPGPEACNYYQKRCEQSCGEDRYACEAKKCCESFGDNRGSNCTRKCLIDEDVRQCAHLTGAARNSCRKLAHIGCYTVCTNTNDAFEGRFGNRPPAACIPARDAVGGMWSILR